MYAASTSTVFKYQAVCEAVKNEIVIRQIDLVRCEFGDSDYITKKTPLSTT